MIVIHPQLHFRKTNCGQTFVASPIVTDQLSASVHRVRKTVITPTWSRVTTWSWHSGSGRFDSLRKLVASKSFALSLSLEDDLTGKGDPQVRTLYKSHQGISIHCETAILSGLARCILSHNWFVPPPISTPREIEQCPRVQRTMRKTLSFLSLIFSVPFALSLSLSFSLWFPFLFFLLLPPLSFLFPFHDFFFFSFLCTSFPSFFLPFFSFLLFSSFLFSFFFFSFCSFCRSNLFSPLSEPPRVGSFSF